MRGRPLVVAILALALVVRLGLAVLHDPPAATGDAADFARHAAALADHGSYPQSAAAGEGPTAFRPPAYPLALAAVYEVAGREDAPRVFGALLGTVAVALLGLVALDLFGRATAVAAMAIGAVFPPLVMVSVAPLSEGLFIVLVLGALACALAARRHPDRVAWVAAAGALGGLAALTRTNGLVLLLPLLLAVPRRRAVLVAAALVVLVPWSVRSSTALDAFVPTTTQAGFTLAGSYNDEARTDERLPAAWRPPVMPPYAALLEEEGPNEAELEANFRGEVLDYAGDHPLYPLRVVFWATVRMLNLADPQIERDSAREAGVGRGFVTVNRYATWALLALAVAGALTAAARAAPRWLWLFPVMLWLGVAIAIGATRYRTPVDPFLILLAALAVVRWRPA
ncbi:MAG TPA: glycosyltransferase family 39 protein [Solirubrobacteraceae bacterium]|nr:glycosyltransferase family 39 protein [Solirubrobacteraceae bacterium]